jgi:hypothetical protein
MFIYVVFFIWKSPTNPRRPAGITILMRVILSCMWTWLSLFSGISCVIFFLKRHLSAGRGYRLVRRFIRFLFNSKKVRIVWLGLFSFYCSGFSFPIFNLYLLSKFFFFCYKIWGLFFFYTSKTTFAFIFAKTISFQIA